MIHLIGASGHAKVIIEILEETGFSIGGLLDSDPSIKSLLGYQVEEYVLGANIPDGDIIVSIGNNKGRKKIAVSNDYRFGTAIHPSANISKRSSIDEGTVVMAGATINADVRIGKHVIINTNASIDHDCIIHDYVHISPNVALGGIIEVGEGTHIGIGACIKQCIKIGKWCTIGAGAVIIRDVPDGATVVGNPGRIIKQNSI